MDKRERERERDREREREKVDRVGEMTVIENDVFTLYCYKISELFVNKDLMTCSPY